MSERVRVPVSGPLTWDTHELSVVHIDAVDLRAAGWVSAGDVQEAIRRLEQGNLDSALRCLRLLTAPGPSREAADDGQ